MEDFSKNDIKILKLLVLNRLVDLVEDNEDNYINTESLLHLYDKLKTISEGF